MTEKERIEFDLELMENSLEWIRRWVPEVEKYTAALEQFSKAKSRALKTLKDM